MDVLALDDAEFETAFTSFSQKMLSPSSPVQGRKWSEIVKPLFDKTRSEVILSIAKAIVNSKDYAVPFPIFLRATRIQIGNAYRIVFSKDALNISDEQYAKMRETAAFQCILDESQEELLRLLTSHRERSIADGNYDILIDAAHVSIKMAVDRYQEMKYGQKVSSRELVQQYNSIFDELFKSFPTDFSVYNMGHFAISYITVLEFLLGRKLVGICKDRYS